MARQPRTQTNILVATHQRLSKLATLHHRSIAAEIDYLADKELLSMQPMRESKKPTTPSRTNSKG
jgi:hypothetical protein